MLIQAPGSWIVLSYLAFLERQNFTTWGSYLVAGIQQVLLLFLLIYFEYFHRRIWKSAKKDPGSLAQVSISSSEGETSPLVAHLTPSTSDINGSRKSQRSQSQQEGILEDEPLQQNLERDDSFNSNSINSAGDNHSYEKNHHGDGFKNNSSHHHQQHDYRTSSQTDGI